MTCNLATNLQIDDQLLTRAQKVGGLKTKKATVTQALEEYIQRREQAKITRVFGTIDYDPEYDYKAGRKRS
jgi:Arc/MetJ family transcription regulator